VGELIVSRSVEYGHIKPRNVESARARQDLTSLRLEDCDVVAIFEISEALNLVGAG
jgi:hypothetical protein